MTHSLFRYLTDSGAAIPSALVPASSWATYPASTEENALRKTLMVSQHAGWLVELVLSYRHLSSLVAPLDEYYVDLWEVDGDYPSESVIEAASNDESIMRALVGQNTVDLFSDASTVDEKVAVLAATLILLTKSKHGK